MTDYEGRYEDEEPHAGSSNAAGPQGALVKREGFGTRELASVTETNGAGVTARETAIVQSRYVMALQRPRVLDEVSRRIILACQRPRFAETAWYKKPQGKKKDENGRWVPNFVEGASIRFAEECLRTLGNMEVSDDVTYDDAAKRLVRVTAVDLETNAVSTTTVTVEKTVERKKLGEGQRPISTRTNSYGDLVYVVEATPDEVDMRTKNLVAKARRTAILGLVPADIIEDAKDAVMATRNNANAKDPAAARKKLIDAFFAKGVKPTDLIEYLGGRPLDALTPDLLDELRGLYSCVVDGDSWRDLLAASPYRTSEAEGEDTTVGAAAREKVKGKIEEIRAKRGAPTQGAPPPTNGGAAPAPAAAPAATATAAPPPVAAKPQAPASAPATTQPVQRSLLTDEERAAAIDRGEDPDAPKKPAPAELKKGKAPRESGAD